jgi:predicted PurR-regulated permease PerM
MVDMARLRRPGGLLTGLAAGVVVAAGLKLGAPVLVPLAFALFLAVLIEPLFALCAKKLPVGAAIGAALLLLLAVFALFGVLLLGSLGELREAGPHYVASLEERVTYTLDWWRAKGIAIEEWLPTRWREPESVGRLVGGAVRGTLTLLSEVTIVLLVLVFLLSEAAALPRKLARLPAPARAALQRFEHVSQELQRYLVIKTLMSLAIGVAAGLWVALLGVDLAVLCGLAAFACHYIPNIGAVLSALPAMAIAFVQYDPMKALAVGAGYLVIGTVLGSLVEPALLGRHLGLSPLVVFVSLVVWGFLWGPVGMFLSVPLTMAIKIVLAADSEWRWLAILLDAAPPAGGAGVPAPSPAPEPAAREAS